MTELCYHDGGLLPQTDASGVYRGYFVCGDCGGTFHESLALTFGIGAYNP